MQRFGKGPAMTQARTIFALLAFAFLFSTTTQFNRRIVVKDRTPRIHDRSPKAKDHTPQVHHLLQTATLVQPRTT